MELKITNPTAPSFNEAVGIPEDRASELSYRMDEIMKTMKGVVRTCDVFFEITAICNNLEEVVYCTINHCNWAFVQHGVIYCPPQKKQKRN